MFLVIFVLDKALSDSDSDLKALVDGSNKPAVLQNGHLSLHLTTKSLFNTNVV